MTLSPITPAPVTTEAKANASVRVDRHNDRTDIFLDPGNVLIARRNEANGEVSWHQELDSEDKASVVRILARMPWKPPLNRAQRRRMKVLAKRAKKGAR